GALIRIAGTGRAGQTLDGPALSAQLDYPVGIAADSAGNVYYLERGSGRLRRVSAEGVLSTLPVEGIAGPMGLRFDRGGNLYVADTAADVVRKIAPNGAVTTVAGNGSEGFAGDGGPALSASLDGPQGVAVDSAGNLYIADTFNHRVRVVTPDGNISTFAGTGFPGFSGDDGKATAATMILPTDVAVDAAGSVYIADLGNSRVRKVSNGTITTVAGNSGGLPPRDGLSATAVRLAGPTGLAIDGEGALYIAEGSIGSGSGLDGGSFRIWKVASGKITALAGDGYRSFSGDFGPAALAQFDTPAGMAYDSKGNLYIADSENHRIRKISADGTVTTVAGNALPGFSGDGGPATTAELNRPSGVAVDADGNLYIADTGNNRIRMVLSSGRIGTLAGNGNTAFFGDGGSSLEAALNRPQGVAVGPDGIYVADTGNRRIRRIVSAIIDTVAEGLTAPTGVLVDDSLTIWAADPGNGTIRGFQKGGAVTVSFPGARGLAIDPSGAVFASGLDSVIKIGNDGSSSIVAGSGQCCYTGDGGPAAAARLNRPWGLAADAGGNLFIADTGNNAIRVLTATASTFFVRSVANGASNQAGPVAAGEVVTIYGAGLGPGTIATAPLPNAPTELGGTRVLVNGTPAQLLYASAGQVSAVIPSTVVGPSAELVVQYAGASTPAFPLSVALASPAIFTADSTGA
ncbi:MAG TPA: IPT/TIG domain-containing protein, partial [Planctomycetaceae bacterium]